MKTDFDTFATQVAECLGWSLNHDWDTFEWCSVISDAEGHSLRFTYHPQNRWGIEGLWPKYNGLIFADSTIHPITVSQKKTPSEVAHAIQTRYLFQYLHAYKEQLDKISERVEREKNRLAAERQLEAVAKGIDDNAEVQVFVDNEVAIRLEVPVSSLTPAIFLPKVQIEVYDDGKHASVVMLDGSIEAAKMVLKTLLRA